MKGVRLFKYLATGDYEGKIATHHALYKGSVITLNGDKYKVREDAMPSDHPRFESVQLKVIEINAFEMN